MITNLFKAFIMCCVAGVAFAVVIAILLLVTNATNLTDQTNDQISYSCKLAFGAGFLLTAAYTLVTGRKW